MNAHDQLSRSLEPGHILAETTNGPISRATLALFAGASGDHSPLHIDSDFVKSVGMTDVFAHGMLVMAYMGHFLTALAPLEDIRSWNVRFVAITPVHATVRCTGTVKHIVEVDGDQFATIEIVARIDHGQIVLNGDAEIQLRQDSLAQ